MRSSDYKELDDADFTAFQKGLIREKGSEQQRRLLMAARRNQTFSELIRNEIKTAGHRESPLYSSWMSEDEYKQPPRRTEKEMYEAWQELPRRVACRPVFWGHQTMRHIEKGYLNAHFLAGSVHRKGLEEIDKALSEKGEGAKTAVDRCVRSILRRLSGLIFRGNRSVYSDCPFGRAWWRAKLVSDIADSEERARSIREVLYINQTYWENLINMVVSRNSALGSENVLYALILSLADLMELERGTLLRFYKHLKLLCRSVGVIQASRELSILNEKELRGVMDDLVLTAHDQAQGKTDNATLTDK